MSKRKKQDWDAFRAKVGKKRTGNNKAESAGLEFLTVQRLSSSVEGKCQKYSRIGPLTMVPLNCEATLQNIKEACKKHFQLTDMECDLLAGERGPSFTETSQIKNWKVLHIRFIEPGTARPDASNRQRDRLDKYPPQSAPASPSKSLGIGGKNPPQPSMMPASMPLSEMLKLGKLITPNTDIVTLTLEEFSVTGMKWLEPFQVRLSLQKEKFASGTFRNAYEANSLSGIQNGRYVLKKMKENQIHDIEQLFNSVEDHTRKAVQMNSLARNFAKNLELEKPQEFGDSFSYTKVYFGKLNGECVTVENFLDSTARFSKYVNNTGDIYRDGSEVSLKAETFVHYTYVKSGKKLMVVDIQGKGYSLCDPEIASADLRDVDDNTILFCSGNLSYSAIEKFDEVHVCNRYCTLLKLDQE